MLKATRIYIDSSIKVADKLKKYLEKDSTLLIDLINTKLKTLAFEKIIDFQKVLVVLSCKNERNCIEYIRQLKNEIPNLYCLLLVQQNSKNYMFDILNSGINGLTFENSALCVICDNIYQVLNGGMPITSELAKQIYHSWHDKTKLNLICLQKLTLREREIIEFLAKGYLYKEIAYHHNISMMTVKNHLKSIYRKLEVTNRSEAILKYFGNLS